MYIMYILQATTHECTHIRHISVSYMGAWSLDHRTTDVMESGSHTIGARFRASDA